MSTSFGGLARARPFAHLRKVGPHLQADDHRVGARAPRQRRRSPLPSGCNRASGGCISTSAVRADPCELEFAHDGPNGLAAVAAHQTYGAPSARWHGGMSGAVTGPWRRHGRSAPSLVPLWMSPISPVPVPCPPLLPLPVACCRWPPPPPPPQKRTGLLPTGGTRHPGPGAFFWVLLVNLTFGVR